MAVPVAGGQLLLCNVILIMVTRASSSSYSAGRHYVFVTCGSSFVYPANNVLQQVKGGLLSMPC